MKLKNIRVRLKDIHHGKILYVAHPACGIEKVQIVGKPKPVVLGRVFNLPAYSSLFIDTIPLDCDWWDHSKTDSRSLCDIGVINPYGYRRTFHTFKQAQQYIERTKNCPQFQKSWNDHLREYEMFNSCYTDYDDC